MMPFELSTVPTSFYHRLDQMKWDLAVDQGRLLGFGWGRGDPSRTIHKVVWIRWFVQIPSWFLLIILAILPIGWFRWRKSWAREDRRVARRYLLVGSSIPLTALTILGALLAINTTFLGPGETPLLGRTSHPAVLPESEDRAIELTIMTYNIWMGGAYKGFWRFENPERVAERVRRIGKLIKKHDPDLVFLQEVVMESGPGSVDQTPLIAEASGVHAWVFGEAFNHGLPFYRVIEGNAILSRWPLAGVANQPMAGRSLFYKLWVANQRTLWCKTRIGKHEVLLASVHLTSHKDKFRPVQMQQILDFVGDQTAIIAGDFNASPENPVIEQIMDTGRFRAQFSEIDHIFVPKTWKLLKQQEIESDLSDHLPVLATFHIPLADELDSSD
jgi:endonuclease/exonuclease/phosphatase family metal-dependent hydrolase